MDEALRRITERRAEIDDEGFAMIDPESPGQVLDYLQRNPTTYPGVVQRDIEDGLVLWVWLWWESQRQLHALLTRGKKTGMSLLALGSPLGMGLKARMEPVVIRKGKPVRRNYRQGVNDRIDRLQALLTRGSPNAELSRVARRVATPDPVVEEPQVAWLVRNREAVVAAARGLLAIKDLANDDAYAWLIEVGHDLREDEWSPASLTIMGLAVEELRAMPEVVGLPSQHRVKRACHAVDEVRTAFTNDIDLPCAQQD